MAASDDKSRITVTGLNVFPIKSCQAVQVEEITLDSFGVVDDRRFMLVDGNKRFVSQRKFPKLATVRAWYTTSDDVNGREKKRYLHASAPSMEEGLVFEPKVEGERIEASVWESRVSIIDQGEDPASWFTQLIGHGGTYLRLVASAESTSSTDLVQETTSSSQGDGFHRLVDNLPPGLRQRLPPMKIALADAGPISLVSNESLTDVNRRINERGCNNVPLNRFRINIEVSGCSKAFEEDEWLLLRIGSVPFLAYTNAERCKMTGIDQKTGEQDKLSPLDILRTYRAPRGPTHAMFGQLMIALQTRGKVKLGDTVEIIDKKKK